MDAPLETGGNDGVRRQRVIRLAKPEPSPGQLRHGIDDAEVQGADRIVVALDRGSLLTADVLDTLRQSAAGLSARGRCLVVVCPDAAVRGLLEGTGLARDYELADSLEAA
jgi:hypothetical protein